MKKIFPPQFTAAMHHYEIIARIYGEESDQAIDAFTSAMLKAPDWFKDEANQMAKDMGLIPEPSGYTSNGEPVYSLSDMAQHLGVSQDEAVNKIQKLEAEYSRQGLTFQQVQPDDFHRKQ